MKEKWSNFLKTWKRPTGWRLVLTYFLTFIFCAAAITLAIIGTKYPALAYVGYAAYGLAAVTLAYTVYTVVIFAPGMKANLTAWIKKTAFGRRMLESYGFRTVIFAACSTAVNVAYVLFHIVLGCISRPFWYGSLAAYYAMLIALRGGILLYQRKRSKTDEEDRRRLELRKYRTCGILLTIIPLCMVIPILQIVFLDQAFVHMGWTVFAFAAYAFYKIIMAVYNLIKVRKQEDLTVQAIRCVSFADALVSIFSLQTALLFAFAEGSYRAANIVTGSAVCVFTIVLGVYMICRAHKKKKEWQEKA